MPVINLVWKKENAGDVSTFKAVATNAF